jgi:hypothetical protein
MAEEHYDIRILQDGTWLYQGTPITRHNLVKLFASVLRRDDRGGYWLETPAERGRIAVDDVPFMAVEMKTEGAGQGQRLSFRTNMDEWVTAGAEHPLRFSPSADGKGIAPYILVRGGMEARLTRAVYPAGRTAAWAYIAAALSFP